MDLNFPVPPEFTGARLDQVLSSRLPSYSRSRVAGLIQEGNILLDGKQRRPGYRVKPGQIISGVLPENRAPVLKPIPMALSVLHEDDHILIIDKPAGLVVHPGAGHVEDTLVNGLLAYNPAFRASHWDPLRPGIVHRLDQDTSGLLLLAKTKQALEFLQKEFQQRRVDKTYLALVHGDKIPDRGQIEKPIGRHPKKRKLMTVVNEIGKYAKTGFVVLQRFDSSALMEVRLYTGRTHQIRVHFYDQGMPLLGDRVYQTKQCRKAGTIAPRQMLHSWKLSFRHPYSGQRHRFQAPIPEDFQNIIETLRA